MSVVLEARSIRVEFQPRRAGAGVLRAVRDVDLVVREGETLALVGESGSGKSSLARGILGLIPLAGGAVTLDGADLGRLRGRGLRRARRAAQMVFQDPYSSLDPMLTVGQSIAEPLEVNGTAPRREFREIVGRLLEAVGLSPVLQDRYPHEFSGGQRQRVAIARAIAIRPKLLICDEAVSALDVSTQNQIVGLLKRLQHELGMACLFITHDLALVRHIARSVGVMYLGQIVEQGSVEAIYADAAHPYTRALMSAVPVADPVLQRRRSRTPLSGEIPDPVSPPSGCSFHPRCPRMLDMCRTVLPPMRPIRGTLAACHNPHEPSAKPVSAGPAPARPRRAPYPQASHDRVVGQGEVDVV